MKGKPQISDQQQQQPDPIVSSCNLARFRTSVLTAKGVSISLRQYKQGPGQPGESSISKQIRLEACLHKHF